MTSVVGRVLEENEGAGLASLCLETFPPDEALERGCSTPKRSLSAGRQPSLLRQVNSQRQALRVRRSVGLCHMTHTPKANNQNRFPQPSIRSTGTKSRSKPQQPGSQSRPMPATAYSVWRGCLESGDCTSRSRTRRKASDSWRSSGHCSGGRKATWRFSD